DQTDFQQMTVKLSSIVRISDAQLRLDQVAEFLAAFEEDTILNAFRDDIDESGQGVLLFVPDCLFLRAARRSTLISALAFSTGYRLVQNGVIVSGGGGSSSCNASLATCGAVAIASSRNAEHMVKQLEGGIV
ncbi:hypothetical protein MMC31_006764, partial [Peltigera leucophlebia]|nr:hypothetical protein [Peltigera leucophlebia]